jgi:tetratricopeptide (TPR) repeat protein
MAAKKSKQDRKKAAPAASPPAASLPAARAWWEQPRWAVLLLAGLCLVLYANTFGHDFALDDAIVITENSFTQQGWSGWSGIFGKDTFFGFFQDESKAALVSGGRYRPLSLALFALEYQLFDGAPAALHVLNVLWYAATVGLLYLLIYRLFDRPGTDRTRAAFIALTTAALFAAHPLHTEAVANIKGRDEILSLLGSLAGTYFALRALDERKLWWGALSGLSFLLALLSKENAITFLAVLPLTLYFFTDAQPGRIARTCLPLVLAAGAFLAVRGAILGWSLGEPVRELMNNPFLRWTGTEYVPFTSGEWSATVGYTLGKYVQLLIVPFPLSHDYYPRAVEIKTWADPTVWGSLLLYTGLLFWAVRGLRKKDPVSYGIWWYLLTLSIVSNIFFPVGTNMSERFLFMPSVGFALAVAVLLDRWRRRPGGSRLAWGIAVAVTLLYGALTVARNPVWRDNFTLFTTDVATAPNSAKLRNAAGGVLIDRWQSLPEARRTPDMLQRAVTHLQTAVEIHPQYKNAYLLLGNAYNYLQQYEASIQAYGQALALDPDYTAAATNLQITLRDAGRYAGERENDLPRAIQYLERALQLAPDDYETLRLLGVSYGVGGDTGRAVEYFRRAAEQAPDNADAWFNLGIAYLQDEQTAAAESAFSRARQLDPEIEQKRRSQ